MDVYIGTIIPWSVPFAPAGWQFCDGSILSVQQYTALYSLIGNMYGGEQGKTFALPDLRGRSPIGTNYNGGQLIQCGTVLGNINQNITVGENNLSAHTHAVNELSVTINARPITASFNGSSNYGGHDKPQNGDYLGASTAVAGNISKMYRGTLDAPVALAGVSGSISGNENKVEGALNRTGGGQPLAVSRVQPTLVINYIIAIQGYYPQRS